MKTPSICIALLCLLFSQFAVSQSSKLDIFNKELTEHTTASDSIRTYLDISNILINGDPKAALEQVLKAKACVDRITDENLKFRVVFREATCIRNMRQHKEAPVLFEQFIEHHKTSGDLNNLTNGYQTAGSLYSREGEYEKSEEYLLKARDYYKELENDYGLARNYRALGSLSRRRGNLPEALDYTFKALEIFEKLGDTRKQSNAHNSLGIIYSSYGDQENAARHFKLNYELSLKDNNKLRAANALQNLASTLPDNHESRLYMNKANNLYSELELPVRSAQVYFNIGVSYKQDNKLDSALYHYNKSSKLYNSAEYDPPTQLTLGMGELYAMKGQAGEARKLLDESAKEMHSMNELSEVANSYGILSKSYSLIGDYKNAYDYRLEQNVYQDSIIKLDQNEIMAKLETTYRVKGKDLEIQTLEAQSEVSNLKLYRRNLMAGFLGLGLLMMLVLVYKIKAKNKKIESQNLIIRESLLEKETLLNEIHHRVKNNLQIISSLLNIQSRSITDKKAKEAILIGKNRVHSMSLIHENLYDKDNLTGILISNYLPKLVEDLKNSYNTSLGDISIGTDIDPIELDVDTVIPIGLIVNELITNCLKYAFPDNRDGVIAVKLKEENQQLILSVSDNGIGMSEEMEKERMKAFGHKIIKAFRVKLGADILISGSEGTSVELTITKYKKAGTVNEIMKVAS